MKILLQKCKAGIKANLIPGIVLQILGLLIVLGYYNVQYVQEVCQ